MPYRDERRPSCPKCESPLEYRQDRGVAYACCSVCQGLWLAADALRAVLVRSGARDAADVVSYLDMGFSQESRRRCVGCQQSLLTRQIMGVEIDYCPRCRGIFLDAGELEQVVVGDAAIAPTERFESGAEYVAGAVYEWYFRGHGPMALTDPTKPPE